MNDKPYDLEALRVKWPDVPATLEEALHLLDRVLPEEIHQEVDNFDPSADRYGGLSTMHLRNSWGLWQDSPLAIWFRERGVWHADDMSYTISHAYCRHRHSLPVGEDWLNAEEVPRYQQWWAKSGTKPESIEEMLDRVAGYAAQSPPN